MSKKKKSLPFDVRGGRQTIQGVLLDSICYLSLSAQSKVLMTLLQRHWNNFKPVDYGVREAGKKIPCSPNTASKSFNQLQEKGFIVMIDHSIFSSRTDSKSRTWRLTWMPYQNKKATNEWENIK